MLSSDTVRLWLTQMFGLSKVVAERNAAATKEVENSERNANTTKEVESSLPLRTVVQE